MKVNRVRTTRHEGAEAMVVPGPTARRGRLVPYQLAQQLEEWEAQRARGRAGFAFRAQHLQLDRLGARAHPRRYRRAMASRARAMHTDAPRYSWLTLHARLASQRNRYSSAADTGALAAARAHYAPRGVAFCGPMLTARETDINPYLME